MDVHTFRVYVTETENFLTKLEPIKPSYNKPPETFINTVPFDYHSDSYVCSLAAMLLCFNTEFPRITLRTIFPIHTPT
jgi:hypothetical protein